MGLEHMKNPPVYQGENANYCWAASLSWWLKAVFNRQCKMDEIIYIYGDYVNDEEGRMNGALNEMGLYKLMHDQRWHLHHDKMKNDKVTLDYLSGKLARSPVMVAYYEPSVKGFHMNVIVAGAGIGDLASGLVVMDPNYEQFQIRNLKYYKDYYSNIICMYKASLGPEPTYAYQ